MQCTKPWRDLEKYRRDRLREALYEAELAEEFLKNGLLRDAAGKAFQAVKAYLAAAAAQKREALAPHYPVEKAVQKRRVAVVALIVAYMPTTRMKEVAARLGDNELELVVEKALDLRRFQYNGLDKEGVFSRYVATEIVEKDVRDVVEFIKRRAALEMGRGNE
ncbi:MAG: PaREP1 family protein [Pyrobaculum sp.]